MEEHFCSTQHGETKTSVLFEVPSCDRKEQILQIFNNIVMFSLLFVK